MDDAALFDRQRRNVMVTSGLLIAAWLVKADFSHFNLFGLAAGAPHRIGDVWAILILYFLWRLYQVTGKEQTDETQSLFMEIFTQRLTKVARKEIITDKRDEFKKNPRPSWQLVSLLVVPVEGSATYKDYKFTAEFYVSSKWKTPDGANSHESGNRKKSYVVGQSQHEDAVRFAKVLVMLKRKSFTEYLLPYLLGTMGVLVGILGF